MEIYIDTNFMLIPSNFKVDIFQEIDRLCDFKYKIVILDKTIDELNKIIETQKGKHKTAASLALQLIQKKKIDKSLTIQKTSSKEDVDNILISIAKKQKIIVATQDKDLKRHLKKEHTKIIDLRRQQYLVITS
jgi:uncharacterized protein